MNHIQLIPKKTSLKTAERSSAKMMNIKSQNSYDVAFNVMTRKIMYLNFE